MRRFGFTALLAAALATVGSALAGSTADPGISSDSILIGGTSPISGEASSAAAVARGAEAYFKSVNAAGGVNKRKIDYKYLDDGYDPSKTVQVIRELVGLRVACAAGVRARLGPPPRPPALRRRQRARSRPASSMASISALRGSGVLLVGVEIMHRDIVWAFDLPRFAGRERNAGREHVVANQVHLIVRRHADDAGVGQLPKR